MREFLDRLHVAVDLELCVRKKRWLESVVYERYGFHFFLSTLL